MSLNTLDKIIATFVALLFIFIGSMVIFHDEIACNRYANIAEVNTKYDFFGGCFIQIEDRNQGKVWIHKDTYELRYAAEIGLLNLEE